MAIASARRFWLEDAFEKLMSGETGVVFYEVGFGGRTRSITVAALIQLGPAHRHWMQDLRVPGGVGTA